MKIKIYNECTEKITCKKWGAVWAKKDRAGCPALSE
jgi:hypothetical protein